MGSLQLHKHLHLVLIFLLTLHMQVSKLQWQFPLDHKSMEETASKHTIYVSYYSLFNSPPLTSFLWLSSFFCLQPFSNVLGLLHLRAFAHAILSASSIFPLEFCMGNLLFIFFGFSLKYNLLTYQPSLTKLFKTEFTTVLLVPFASFIFFLALSTLTHHIFCLLSGSPAEM